MPSSPSLLLVFPETESVRKLDSPLAETRAVEKGAEDKRRRRTADKSCETRVADTSGFLVYTAGPVCACVCLVPQAVSQDPLSFASCG